MTTEIQKSYALLGVFPDDDWETVRSAYKRQIRRWHPDRFQDPDQQRIAELKSKEINLAYQTLDNFYKEFGFLPPDERPESSSMHEDQNPDVARGSDSKTEFDSSAFSAPESSFRRTAARFVLAGTIVAAGYLVVVPPSFDLPAKRYAEKETSDGTWHSGQGYLEQDVPFQVSPGEFRTSDAQGVNPNRKSKIEKATSASTASVDTLPYITRGSSKQHVLEIQGRPLRETDAAWDYGLSQIHFSNDKVIGWYENPMNPLVVER